MTAVQIIKYLIESNWQEARTGRALDVPEPEIHLENDEQKVDLSRHDEVMVKDGGPVDHTPLGVGYNYEREELTMSVDLKTADRRVQGDKIDGRVRLFGFVNNGNEIQHGIPPGESEDYGGISGEVKKILRDNRGGQDRFDDIFVDSVDDISDTVAVNKYRAVVNVRLRDRTVEL